MGSDLSVFHFGSLYLTRELIWSDLVKVCAACKLVYSTIDWREYYELDNNWPQFEKIHSLKLRYIVSENIERGGIILAENSSYFTSRDRNDGETLHIHVVYETLLWIVWGNKLQQFARNRTEIQAYGSPENVFGEPPHLDHMCWDMCVQMLSFSK